MLKYMSTFYVHPPFVTTQPISIDTCAITCKAHSTKKVKPPEHMKLNAKSTSQIQLYISCCQMRNCDGQINMHPLLLETKLKMAIMAD